MIMKKPTVNIGDRICVVGHKPVRVSDVVVDMETGRVRLILDWGGGQTSKVWLHDENEVWYRYSDSN
jgi:hypothetical protein